MPGTETTLASNTNAPAANAPANNLPHEVAPVFIVILSEASMFPLNSVFVPSVAEVPACHDTLEALAPLTRMIRECGPGGADPAAKPIVLDDWKTKVAFGSPWASSTISPVIKIDVSD